MKYIIIFFLIFNFLHGATINNSVLNIHATLVPKLSLMDYQLEQKLDNNAIYIAIYYSNLNYKSAKFLKTRINLKYKNGLKKFKVKTKLIPYSDKKTILANIYYLFPTSDSNVKNILKNAIAVGALTFSYSKNMLSLGSMISIDIGAKVKPIINLDAIKTNEISLRPVLLNISEIYKQEI